MDDLQRRFRRLDRVATPNLWNEAVARAVELEMAPRRTFTPGFALIATALLLAALGGTDGRRRLAQPRGAGPRVVTYENGVIMANDGCGRLVSLDPTSGEVREVVAASAACGLGDFSAMLRPAWSSDGSRLAYLAAARTDFGVADEAGVWVYQAATGETRQVTECSEYCDGVDISPDGSHVAYISTRTPAPMRWPWSRSTEGETYRIDLPGGRPGTGGAAFSPDGSHIALSMIGGKSGVYLVDVSGLEDGTLGSPTLLHGIVQADNLAWSPNGEWIAYTQTGGLGVDSDVRSQAGAISQPGSGIVVVRADGTEVRALAPGQPTTVRCSRRGRRTRRQWRTCRPRATTRSNPIHTRALDGGDRLWRAEADLWDRHPLRLRAACLVAGRGVDHIRRGVGHGRRRVRSRPAASRWNRRAVRPGHAAGPSLAADPGGLRPASAAAPAET